MRSIALGLMLCTLTAQSVAVAEPDQAEDEAIEETVLRDYLKSWSKNGGAVFLALVRDADPSDAFLARLSDLKVDIRKASVAKAVTSKNQTFFDRRTNEPGTLIQISRIHRVNRRKARVDFRRHKGGLNASGYEYVLEKVNERWKIVERKHVSES